MADPSPFPLDLHVTVEGRNPHEIRQNALDRARDFFGRSAVANLVIAQSMVEVIEDRHGFYKATIVFRQAAQQ